MSILGSLLSTLFRLLKIFLYYGGFQFVLSEFLQRLSSPCQRLFMFVFSLIYFFILVFL